MNPAGWPAAGQLLLAWLVGAVSVLAFAPFGFGLIACLSLAVLFYLWRHPARPGLNLWTGYAFGLGLLGFGVSWIHVSISEFGGTTPAFAGLVTLLFVLFVALYFALAGWIGERLRGRSELAWLVLVLPAVWVLIEWLRGWFLTGFPWLALGYSQIDLPLAGYAPLLGIYGVTLMLVLSAALLNLAPRWPAMLALLVLWAAGFGLMRFDWSEPAGEAFRASLVQGNIAQEDKWLSSMRQRTLDLYLDMTAAVPDSRLVVWPETAVPALAGSVEESLLKPLHDGLRAQGRDLLLGIVDGDLEAAYFNAMLSLGASGRDHYHKRHLVPLGEYLPFDRFTRPVLDFLEIPMSDFTAGANGRGLVELAGYPAGVDICYEDAYPAEIIRALPEAAFLVNASNDAWFGDSLAPHQHLEIARMRALETGRYLLRATNTGISAIVDHHGKLRAVAPQFERATLTGEVLPRKGSTPFVRWGNAGLVTLAGLMLLGALLRQRFGR